MVRGFVIKLNDRGGGFVRGGDVRVGGLPGGFAHSFKTTQQIGPFEVNVVPHFTQGGMDRRHGGGDLVGVWDHHACVVD